jgi:hypothetical protein
MVGAEIFASDFDGGGRVSWIIGGNGRHSFVGLLARVKGEQARPVRMNLSTPVMTGHRLPRDAQPSIHLADVSHLRKLGCDLSRVVECSEGKCNGRQSAPGLN